MDSGELELAITRTRLAYEAAAENYEAHFGGANRFYLHRKILSLLEASIGPLEERRILDVGCGAGGLMRLLAGTGACCSGTDVAWVFLRSARKHDLAVAEGSAHS